MSLAAGQYSYNGLVFGSGCPITVASSEGIDDLPSVVSGDTQSPRSDGLLPGLDYLGGRTVTLNLNVSATSLDTVPQLLDMVKAAFAPIHSGGGLPLVFCRPGLGNRQMTCRARKMAGPMQGPRASGSAQMALQLVAADPLIYDATTQSVTVQLPTPSSGMKYPLTYPLTFGGTTGGGGIISASNAGNWPTAPTAVISGPVTNPRLENETTGETLALNIQLAAGDKLTLDFAAHTILLNGSGDRYSAWVAGSKWWTLAPGVTRVGFFSSDASPTGATLQLSWASAWL